MPATTTAATAAATINGWTNWATWNVALWLQNDEELYKVARQHDRYNALIPYLEDQFGKMTPDGCRWMDPTIDADALDEVLATL